MLAADPELAFAEDRQGKTPMSHAVSAGATAVYAHLYKIYKKRKML